MPKGKEMNGIDSLSTTSSLDLSNEIKCEFFKVITMPVLLSGCSV